MNKVKAEYNKRYIRKTDGKSAIYVTTVIHREKIIFPTGILINPKAWDEENECVKQPEPMYKDYNLIINNAN